MSERVAADRLDLSRWIRPGDAIVWGQACGEPTTLTEALVAQRAGLGGVSAFVGSAFSATLRPEHSDHIAFASMGAIGTLARLAAAGVLDIVPTHVGQVGAHLGSGAIGCDVAMVQLSPPGPDGRHSLGLIGDYVGAMIDKARVVIAEVNDQVPYVAGDRMLAPGELDVIVETSRPPVAVAPGEPDETERAIAAHAGAYIGDGAVLQMGIGAVPEAIARLLGDRRRLGVHSGMIGEGIGRLMQSGAIDNSTKPADAGITVTGALIGGPELYAFANRNTAFGLRGSAVTHGEAVLAAIPRLVSINSAIEVDLAGQVNAEQIGARYLGATGGQVDYVRAGARSPGGRAIVALPATARGGSASRIVAALSGPVTTARSEADVIVTEYGAAELKGQGIRERVRRMIAIAAPAFRDALERAAHDMLKRGY